MASLCDWSEPIVSVGDILETGYFDYMLTNVSTTYDGFAWFLVNCRHLTSFVNYDPRIGVLYWVARVGLEAYTDDIVTAMGEIKKKTEYVVANENFQKNTSILSNLKIAVCHFKISKGVDSVEFRVAPSFSLC